MCAVGMRNAILRNHLKDKVFFVRFVAKYSYKLLADIPQNLLEAKVCCCFVSSHGTYNGNFYSHIKRVGYSRYLLRFPLKIFDELLCHFCMTIPSLGQISTWNHVADTLLLCYISCNQQSSCQKQNKYSWTSHKRPSKMSSLGGRLRQLGPLWVKF